MARKRQEDQGPWFFFLRDVPVALWLFSFCQIFPFDLKRASPFFQRPNIDQFIDNNENYERWWQIFMSLLSYDLRCNFTTYSTFHFKETKSWQDARHVLEIRASSYPWRTFFFSQKSENSIFRFPLFVELFFASKISGKSYSLENFLIMSVLRLKKMLLFSEIRKF